MRARFSFSFIFVCLLPSCTNYVSGDVKGAEVDDVRSSIYLHYSLPPFDLYAIILTETEDACEDIDDGVIDAREYSLLILYLGDDHEGDYTVYDIYDILDEDISDSGAAYFRDVVNDEWVVEEWAELGSVHLSVSEYEEYIEGDFEVYFSGNYSLEGKFRASYCEIE